MKTNIRSVHYQRLLFKTFGYTRQARQPFERYAFELVVAGLFVVGVVYWFSK